MASQSAIQQSLQSYKTVSSVEDFQSLRNKVVVITVKYIFAEPQVVADTIAGGGDGIGLALVKAVVEFGGHVAVVGNREVAHLDLCEIQDLHKESRVKYFRCAIHMQLTLDLVDCC